MLNWIIATADEYATANITPPATARRWMIDTPTGAQEVILQHVQHNLDLEHPEYTMRSRLLSKCLVTNDELQYLLPIEEVEDALR